MYANIINKISYHNFRGIFHKSNARKRIGDTIKVLVFTVQTVANDVSANNLVLAHLHHTFDGRLWLGLKHGCR